MAAPTYMKSGVTPGWMKARVIDEISGDVIEKVLEIDTREGCLLRQARHSDGRPVVMGGRYQNELLLGYFRIEIEA